VSSSVTPVTRPKFVDRLQASGARADAITSGDTMQTTAPVAALTILGILLAVLGLLVAGNMVIVVIGLLAIFGAGLLQVLGRRA
jgi:hypothetical protein